MKLVFFTFLLISSSALAYENSNTQLESGPSDIIAALIKGIFDNAKKLIPDPLVLPNIGASFNSSPIINGSFEVDDFMEIGLKQINLTDVKVAFLKTSLNFVVNIPRVNINANYMADLLLGSIVPLYGSGPLNIHLKNFQFNFTSKFTFKPLKLLLQLKNTSLITTIDDATFDIHGMLNNEAFSILVSQIFDDTFKLFLNNHTELISKITSPIIENIINSILGKKNKPTVAPTTSTAIPTKKTTIPTRKTTIPTKKTTIPTKSTEKFEDFDEISSELLSEIDTMVDREKLKELGDLFLKTLKEHPGLIKAKQLMF